MEPTPSIGENYRSANTENLRKSGNLSENSATLTYLTGYPSSNQPFLNCFNFRPQPALPPCCAGMHECRERMDARERPWQHSYERSNNSICGGALPGGGWAVLLETTFSTKVPKNLLNCDRVFHASNDLDWTFALLTDLDVNIEYPFQSLHPGHRDMALRLCLIFPCFIRLCFAAFPSPSWSDMNPVFAIGGKNPMTNSSGWNLDNRRLPRG